MNRNGRMAEIYFTTWLMEKGFDVFIPMDYGSPVDVVWRAEPGAPWRSAQVKKVYRKRGYRTVDVTRKDGNLYGEDDWDYLACVDYEEGYVYLLAGSMDHRGRPIRNYTRLRLRGEKWRARRFLLKANAKTYPAAK